MCSSLETPTPTVSENGAHCAAGGRGAFQVEVEVEESVIIPSPQSFSGMKDRRPEVMVCKCILPVFTHIAEVGTMSWGRNRISGWQAETFLQHQVLYSLVQKGSLYNV
jgi:hypothetical protein